MDIAEVRQFTKYANILLVEDETSAREMLSKILGNICKYVEVAIHGRHALHILEQQHVNFDIIISDITMPVMNGLEFVRELKKIKNTVPVIILSAHSDSQHLIELINEGVDSFLLKPINISNLADALYKASLHHCDAKTTMGYIDQLELESIRLKNELTELREIAADKKAQLKDAIEIIKNQRDIISQSQENTQNSQYQINNNPKCKIADSDTSEETHTHTQTEHNTDELSKDRRKEVLHYDHISEITAENFFATLYDDEITDIMEMDDVECEFADLVKSLGTDCGFNIYEKMANEIERYAKAINQLYEFKDFAYALHCVRTLFSDFACQNDGQIIHNEMIQDILGAFIDDLYIWRKTIFIEKTATNIHYMDASLMNTCLMIEQNLCGHHSLEEESQELYFF